MDNIHNLFSGFNLKSSNVCCEILLKIRQYINIFQIELSRLGKLQFECNHLLDQFYAFKREFDFLTKEALLIKYIGEDESVNAEYINEVSTFLTNLWQIGKCRFSDKSKTSEYICFIGSPLGEVISVIHSYVDEIMAQIYYQPYHSECAAAICSLSAQIYTTLQGESLPSADACFRQYIYLTAANPFLQHLNLLIHKYLTRDDVHTTKQFIDTIILDIPNVSIDTSGEDSKEMVPFRFVVDLLNGKLLDDDFLDHRSNIRPVVEDDVNLTKSLQARDTVQWIMQQYSVPDVNRMWVQSAIPMSADFAHRNKTLHSEFYSVQSSMLMRSHKNFAGPNCNSMESSYVSRNYSARTGTPLISQRRGSKRGRKKVHKNNQSSSQNDLQPIILHTLQSPILKPLF